jgi:hypothetical protein
MTEGRGVSQTISIKIAVLTEVHSYEHSLGR